MKRIIQVNKKNYILILALFTISCVTHKTEINNNKTNKSESSNTYKIYTNKIQPQQNVKYFNIEKTNENKWIITDKDTSNENVEKIAIDADNKYIFLVTDKYNPQGQVVMGCTSGLMSDSRNKIYSVCTSNFTKIDTTATATAHLKNMGLLTASLALFGSSAYAIKLDEEEIYKAVDSSHIIELSETEKLRKQQQNNAGIDFYKKAASFKDRIEVVTDIQDGLNLCRGNDTFVTTIEMPIQNLDYDTKKLYAEIKLESKTKQCAYELFSGFDKIPYSESPVIARPIIKIIYRKLNNFILNKQFGNDDISLNNIIIKTDNNIIRYSSEITNHTNKYIKIDSLSIYVNDTILSNFTVDEDIKLIKIPPQGTVNKKLIFNSSVDVEIFNKAHGYLDTIVDKNKINEQYVIGISSEYEIDNETKSFIVKNKYTLEDFL